MIVGVAILHDGRVYALPRPARHCHLFDEYNTEPDVIEHARMHGINLVVGWPAAKMREGDQGFVDDTGRFLTREQAYVVAKAAGQLMPRRGGYASGEVSAGPELFSEDVW